MSSLRFQDTTKSAPTIIETLFVVSRSFYEIRVTECADLHCTHTMSFRDYTRTGDSPREEKKIVKNENTCSTCAEGVLGDLRSLDSVCVLSYL